MCIPVLRVSGPPRKVILRLLLLLRSASTVLLLLLVLLLVLLLLGITSSTKTVSTTPTCTSKTASTYATIILPTGHISTTIIVRLSLIELPPPATPPPPTPWRGGWTMGWDGGATQHLFTVFQVVPWRYLYYYATTCHVSFGLNCLSDECSTQNSVAKGW